MTREKLWNANYIKIWTTNFLVHFSFMLIVPLLPLYLSETFGATKDTIGMVLTGYTIMALTIRPFSGYMVDSFPRKTVLVICGALFFSIFVGYIVAGSLAAFAIFRTLHGAPFGATTVAASTVAIDVVPSSRRGEAIGYYGLSNNLAMALGPALAIVLLEAFNGSYKALFWVSLAASLIGLLLEISIRLPKRDFVPEKKVLSLDRFFLIEGWREAIGIASFAFSYGVLSTYVAIYGKARRVVVSSQNYTSPKGLQEDGMYIKAYGNNTYSEFLEFDLQDVFSENAKRFISESGYTAEQLSYRTNLSVSTINRLKAGRNLTIHGICALAEALGKDWRVFFA